MLEHKLFCVDGEVKGGDANSSFQDLRQITDHQLEKERWLWM